MKTELPSGKITPGRWEINDECDLELRSGNNVIATVYRREDAEFLQAAPELLGACLHLVQTVEDDQQFPDRSPHLLAAAIKQAYAVIAKSEGRS